MLPKVATQLLHSTSRAVSSIKPIRNVLHQPGSSHRNKGGSARFNHARPVAQANAVNGAFVSDDTDDTPPARAPVRIPRPSVVTSVKLHARARHAFAAPEPDAPAAHADDAPAEPKQVSHAARRLLDARISGNPARAVEAVREFRQSVVNPSVREFNAALEALQATRRPGEPLNLMLETYNDMLRHSLLPNVSTYIALIDSLTARDHEVHSAIAALERRIKHRALTGFAEPASDQADRKRIDMLRNENNFNSAMSLFETLLSIGGNNKLVGHTYTSLLRSCALNSNINAAIHIWAQFEKRQDFFPNPSMFLEMIRVYTNAVQLPGAEETFAEYRRALQRGSIHISWVQGLSDPNRLNLLVWNQMIETYFRFNRPDKAVALVEQMLNADVSNPEQQVVVDPPPVSSATFTVVLTGFCHLGDVDTALVWFEKLLAQQPSSSQDPFEPVGAAMKPDDVAWDVIFDALAVKGMTDDLNRLFKIRLKEDRRRIRSAQRTIVYSANMARLQSLDDTDFVRTLAWLLADVLNTAEFRLQHRLNLTEEICTAYLQRNMYEKAFNLLSAYISDYLRACRDQSLALGKPPPLAHVEELQLKFTDKLYQISKGDVPYHIPMELARLAVSLRITQPPSLIPFFLQSYALARANKNLPLPIMTRHDWELLLMAATSFESSESSVPDFAYQGLESLVRDLAFYKVEFQKMDKDIVRPVLDHLSRRLGSAGLLALLKETDFVSLIPLDQYISAIDEDTASETSGADSGYASDTPCRVDPYLSQLIMVKIKKEIHKSDTVLQSVFAQFKTATESGQYPHPTALSFLIAWFGRLGRMEELSFTYNAAQRVLKALENDKVAQTQGWLEVENAMIIGLAHHGDVEAAHQHRQRIFANGGVPSAEAYGALIHNVKDTTDDAANALQLFEESKTYRVVPNQYLYNNIISKLSKARKADYALELFRQMKEIHVMPTSVTYGTVIGACARVGDVNSAEALFTEMVQDPNFAPRIPPYNTMMQIYTTTKPDRARALHFYEELCKARLKPTAHTYKLLLDTYGTIEPVNLEKMNQVFKKLKAEPNVPVQGTHYAALINAYGCVSKDLEQALKVFNTMDILRDPIVYEALFSVFTVHRRADLIHQYLGKMRVEGVHMTAYIANSLIKCYSLLDDIAEARKLFESLEDPPEGVAAPNNHAPHTPLEAAPAIDPNTPVYREPSTWEAMVRAELGSGNRDGALALLERLKTRQYPEAVFNRISGILVDHSQVVVPL